MNNVYRRRIFSAFILLMAVMATYFVYDTLVFRFVGTDPGVNNVATVTPFLKVKFNKDLDSQGLNVSSPQGIIGTYAVQGKLININFKQILQTDQNYTVKIHGIRSKSGKTLPDKSFSFNAQYVPENQLPAEQKSTILNRQQQYKNTLQENSLINVLPFTSGGNEFKVDYNVDGQQFTIYVEAATPTGQQAGIDWIKSLGYNPSNYNIKYVTEQP